MVVGWDSKGLVSMTYQDLDAAIFKLFWTLSVLHLGSPLDHAVVFLAVNERIAYEGLPPPDTLTQMRALLHGGLCCFANSIARSKSWCYESLARGWVLHWWVSF